MESGLGVKKAAAIVAELTGMPEPRRLRRWRLRVERRRQEVMTLALGRGLLDSVLAARLSWH